MRITMGVFGFCFVWLIGLSPLSDGASPEDKVAAGNEARNRKSDDGLGPLLDGLAAEALKAFLNDDLMNEIPGTTVAEKSENVKTLLTMIEGDKLRSGQSSLRN